MKLRPGASPLAALAGLVRRHPFVVGSLLLHGALGAALWSLGPSEMRQVQIRRDEALIQASLEQARRIQLQRSVRALETLQRELTGGTGPAAEDAALPDDPAALLERARAANAAIQDAERRARERELARLLGNDNKALRDRIASTPQPAPAATTGTPAQQMAALEQQAREAAAAAEARAERAHNGTPVQTADSGARSGQGGGGGDAKAGTEPSRGGAGEGGAPGPSGIGGRGGGGSGTELAGGALQRSAGGGSSDVRQYGEQARVTVPRGGERLARGRSLGAGGVRADRVYLDTWYTAGPFAGADSRSLATVHAPELGVDLDAVYAGKGGQPVRWRHVQSGTYPLVPQPRVENAVYYAYTEIRVDVAQDVWLDLGADDDSMLWLNGQRVWVSGGGDKPWYRQPFYTLDESLAHYGLVENSRRVRLQAGRNTLLLKLYNGIDLMFFSVVIRPG